MPASTDGVPAEQQGGADISLLRPELQSQWDHDRNQHINGVIKPRSGVRIFWICRQCPDGHLHTWAASPDNRTRQTDCPFCSGSKVCPHNSLARKAPAVAKQWDLAKNANSPHDYTWKSSHQAHWKCQHGHEWQARIKDLVCRQTGCPECCTYVKQPVVSSNARVMQLWDEQLNAQLQLDPTHLTCGSNKVAHFSCHNCPMQRPHKWQAQIGKVGRNGTGCPFCSKQKVCKCNSLRTKRPDLAAEWCYAKNKGTPDDYTSRSTAKVWWQTETRGVWKVSIASRSCERRGRSV